MKEGFGFTILRFASGVSGALSTFSAAFTAAADRVEGCPEPDICHILVEGWFRWRSGKTRQLPLYTLQGA